MYKYAITIVFCHLIGSLIGQSVLVYGKIIDEKTELPLPFAKVQFAYSKKLHSRTLLAIIKSPIQMTGTLTRLLHHS